MGGFERSGGGFEHPRAVYFKGQQTGWEGAATRMAIVESLQEESAEEAGDFKRTLKGGMDAVLARTAKSKRAAVHI